MTRGLNTPNQGFLNCCCIEFVEQPLELLAQLGLLGEAGGIARDEIAVSPLLVEGALGLRGAAVAITGLRPDGEPNGVVILHPGDSGVLRGLIDTALPAVGVPVVEAIRTFSR